MPRLFIAIPVPAEVTQRLGRFMPSGEEGWRKVRPESLHLTLVFLGNVDERSVEWVGRAMRRAAAQVAPLELSAEGIGAFPTKAKARVVWAGVEGELTTLHDLHDRLASELRAEGFQLDERTYRPHVTLARSRTPRHLPAHLATDTAFGKWQAEEAVLFESELSSFGARYLVRDRAPLRRPARPE